MKRIVVILGPTGIGKTAFAIRVARQFNGEIVGADSMQIYKHLTIGTAKPDPSELALARHHLIDFLEPEDEYDAGRFVRDADRAIKEIGSRGKVPVVAGGTGLYVRALLYGLFRTDSVCRETVERLNRDVIKKGRRYVHERLADVDPQAADRIHPNDTFRTIRALEVFLTTGEKISARQKAHNFNQPRYHALKIGLYLDREKLYERINRRVDIMLEQGLLSEVEQLIKDGYSLDLKSMQSIGYQQMGLFLKGEADWAEAVRLLKRDTRRYAKRQMTWFRKETDILWCRPDAYNEVKMKIKEFLT